MPPPEKLYVYEVEGRVYPPPDLMGEDFLGCWREGECSYLFYSARKTEQVRTWLAAGVLGRFRSETELDYADWEAGQPLRPTRWAGFYLCPVWETPPPGPGDILLRLDPGLAFGSGYHPTTRMCLEFLRRLYEWETPQQVLDLGTGTGILTLAALALGARRVVAVDYNDLAVRTAARNLHHNGRQEEVLLIQGDARHFAHLPADLALANLHLEVLLDLLQDPAFWGKRWYIFSGLLGTQLEPFLARLKQTPLQAVEIRDDNLWFAVLSRRGDD
jgi:ribosomal protein L11 methyltransferase